jgi:hypothetical protein
MKQIITAVCFFMFGSQAVYCCATSAATDQDMPERVTIVYTPARALCPGAGSICNALL